MASQEIFAKDAHEIMQVMVQHFKAGFAADDQTREYIHEAVEISTTSSSQKWFKMLPRNNRYPKTRNT